MPGLRRTRNEREQFLILEFLQESGIQIVGDPEYPDPPDAIVRVREAAEELRLGIELTDYHLDAAPGQYSPAARLDSVFEAIRASIVHRIAHRRDRERLGELEASFHLVVGVTMEGANPLAGEIVDFLSTVELQRGERQTFSSFGPGRELMSQSISRLDLLRRGFAGYSNSCCNWRCFNIGTGNVGIRADFVASAIDRKAAKTEQYRAQSVDRLWLLIVAAGDFAQRRAGPYSTEVARRLDSVRQCAEASGFDGVLFWEYISEWCHEIWPAAKRLW